MAKTLSDTVIIAIIEATTRLAGGRGPIAGSAAGASAASSGAPGSNSTPETAAQGAVTPEASSPAPAVSSNGDGAASGRGEHDTRTAAEIASDFKTLYIQIEEVVRATSEQETKSVGFSAR